MWRYGFRAFFSICRRRTPTGGKNPVAVEVILERLLDIPWPSATLRRQPGFERGKVLLNYGRFGPMSAPEEDLFERRDDRGGKRTCPPSAGSRQISVGIPWSFKLTCPTPLRLSSR